VIKPNNFCSWTKEFMEAGKQRLSRDTTRDATRHEITALKRENTDLKQIVADLSLDLHRMKKTSIPSLDEGGGSA
jgi:transposase